MSLSARIILAKIFKFQTIQAAVVVPPSYVVTMSRAKSQWSPFT